MTYCRQKKWSSLLFLLFLFLLLPTASSDPAVTPESTPITVTVCKIPPEFYIPEIPLSRSLQRFTYELCEREQVDYELALAVMWSESRFEAGAVHLNDNGTRDSGLMQINDVNSGWMEETFQVTNLMDEEQNIRAGVGLLAQFVNRYGERDGLMAYNLGETGMKRAKKRGETTTPAVEKLLKKRDEFERMQKYR